MFSELKSYSFARAVETALAKNETRDVCEG